MPAYAFTHCLCELLIGPGANASLFVGSIVAGEQLAERCFQRVTTRERFAVMRVGVAGRTVAGDRHITTASHCRVFLGLGDGRLDAGAAIGLLTG
ncbi:hypothetical protein BB029_13085 [Pseudomonas sp. S3E12]|nr:hypothetical protein BB029_13085 [Pseudomonas sp. S3E12]